MPPLLALSLIGCRRGYVANTGSYATPSALAGLPLRRPALVLVQDFAVDPSEVQLDSGVGAQVQREAQGTAPNAERARVAHDVRGTLASTLVQRIRDMGFRADVGGDSGSGHDGSVVTVRGQVLDVDEGNRTRRTLIGFGAGKSDLGADVQVYYAPPGEAGALWQTFSADVNSGHMPGLTAGLAAGGLSGNLAASAGLGAGLHVASETRDSPVAQARKLANAVADSLQDVFTRQGWMAGG